MYGKPGAAGAIFQRTDLSRKQTRRGQGELSCSRESALHATRKQMAVSLCLPPQVDEIFGTIQELLFSVKPATGMEATSFKAGDKLYINPEKLLPLQRFLPQPKGAGGGGGKGKGGGGKGIGKGFGKGKGGKGKGDGKGKGGKGGKGSPGKGKGGKGKG
jgi:hypothetical protein